VRGERRGGGAAGPAVWTVPWRRGPRERGEEVGWRRRSAGEREGQGRRVRVSRGAGVLYTRERKIGPVGCVGPVVG
jgi:hypothetical protein